MADLSQHANYTAAYSGLLDNLYLTLAIAGACLVGYEIEVHIPRRRGTQGRFKRVPVRIYQAARRAWRASDTSAPTLGDEHHHQQPSEQLDREEPNAHAERKRLGDREAWEFGYIYQPKAWAVNPSPPVPRRPLMWIFSSLKVRERDMPEKCGLDITLHARFLRGAFFYTLLQTLVIMPILMPLHIIYSPSDIAKTSMLRASVSSLVVSSGSRWLWVHALLIWYITITWTATLLWIAWGAIGYRRREIDGLARRLEAQQRAKQESTRGEEATDPQTMPEECEGVKRFRTLMVTNIPPDMRDEETLRDYFTHYIQKHHERKKSGAEPSEKRRQSRLSFDALAKVGNGEQTDSGEVEEVIMVRKLGTIASLRERRMDVLRKLELAHVNLAKRVLGAVIRYRRKGTSSPLTKDSQSPHAASKAERMRQLSEALEPWVDGIGRDRAHQTVWEALHDLPKHFLDPYQSLTHLTSLWRNENAPLIDYLTTKLEYLTMLLSEARSRPLESYPTSSAAFVTFKDARTARLANKILDNHPKRSLACHTTPAPDWTDILWPRLSRSVYRSEFVRGWVVHLGVWAFTLIWIFPVSLLCALASLTNIAGFIKPLQAFLTAHPKAASAITSLAPVILVALLTIAICPILLVIANKAETIVTRLGVHNSVMERFWKFLMVNGVVFFAIGQSAIEAYLTAFQNSDFDPLPIIASAFPTAAPYFASYILLQVAIQPFFEIFRFGLPTIVYVFGTRVSNIPRQRSSRTEHPTFSHFSQVPQQLLGGAIMHLFMLLNPLVLPFTLVYYGACYLVWKRQFTYVYGRLYETNGKRSSIRILRYSMDALALGQFVLFAFFIFNKAKGHAISTGILFFITLIAKLIITRALRKRFAALDAREADILCPPIAQREGDSPDNASDISDSEDVEADAELAGNESRAADRFGSFKRHVHSWTSIYRRGQKDSRKPIPFDHVLFSTLDTRISFNLPPLPPPTDTGIPNTEIESKPRLLVSRHPALQPWEDIPPYHRARGYADQPAYTDEYDDFLWLPRDPLSTLDLDDTIELRTALTTSAGGSGIIGAYAFDTDKTEHLSTDDGHNQDPAAELLPERFERGSDEPASPGGNSETRLVSNPSIIGSETHNDTIVRRHTLRVVGSLVQVFGRPRGNSTISGDNISLNTLPTSPQEPLTATIPLSNEQDMPLMTRVATPSPMSMLPQQDPMEEASPTEPRSGSHISFSATTLGRSPSGRRPSVRARFGSTNHMDLSVSSPTRQRSLSRVSSQRSGSGLSTQQQRLLSEVMEEERLASKEDKDMEHEDRAKEAEELMKEQGRMRKTSASGEGQLRRPYTRQDSAASRPNMDRAGASSRSGVSLATSSSRPVEGQRPSKQRSNDTVSSRVSVPVIVDPPGEDQGPS